MKYPPGPIYKAEDLPELAGKPLKLPTYLVGNFLYVGKVDGKDSFASFTSSPLRLGNTADDHLSPKFPGWACARKSHQSGQAGTNSAHFGETGQRTAKISLSARTFLATSKMVALEEQTPRLERVRAKFQK